MKNKKPTDTSACGMTIHTYSRAQAIADGTLVDLMKVAPDVCQALYKDPVPQAFKEIGRRFPGIDLALIPIAPARGGNGNHADPKEALQIFADVGARYMIPIHFEAYHSMAVPFEEPRQVLAREVERAALDGHVFALRTGERWMLPSADDAVPWVTHEKAALPNTASR